MEKIEINSELFKSLKESKVTEDKVDLVSIAKKLSEKNKEKVKKIK